MEREFEEKGEEPTPAKGASEKELRRFCLDIAQIASVNDDTDAVIKRAHKYYRFINEGWLP